MGCFASSKNTAFVELRRSEQILENPMCMFFAIDIELELPLEFELPLELDPEFELLPVLDVPPPATEVPPGLLFVGVVFVT